MRNSFKVMNSLGAVALLLSGAAMAAPPVAFNGWSVDNAGVVTSGTAGCTALVVGAGFHQCQMIVGGKTYIQTIIAEGFSAAGTGLDRLSFRSQDFVQIGAGSTQGLASSMGVKDSVTNPGTTFGTTANILTGWAVNTAGNKSEAELALSLNSAATSATSNDAFLSGFNVTAITDAANVNLTPVLGVDQTVGLGGVGTDKQRFFLRNEAADPAITGYTVAGGIGVLNAAAGAPLQGIWVAQSIAGTGDFSVQSLANLNGGANSLTSVTNLLSTAPVDWGTGGVFTAQFGAAPTF